MTAETDIAAINDGGENTAAEVRTALTSVLARADLAAIQLIEAIVVDTPTPTITFSSIPATFSNLEIRAVMRHAGSGGGFNSILVNFNNDTDGNYGRLNTGVIINDSDTTSSEASGDYTGDTDIIVGSVPAADVEADAPGMMTVQIHGYAGTVFEKMVTAVSMVSGDPPGSGTAGFILRHYGGLWRSTAAITEIDITNTASANFVAGSAFYLYGLT